MHADLQTDTNPDKRTSTHVGPHRSPELRMPNRIKSAAQENNIILHLSFASTARRALGRQQLCLPSTLGMRQAVSAALLPRARISILQARKLPGRQRALQPASRRAGARGARRQHRRGLDSRLVLTPPLVRRRLRAAHSVQADLCALPPSRASARSPFTSSWVGPALRQDTLLNACAAARAHGHWRPT